MKKALIVRGGWDGHEPEKVSVRFCKMLKQEGFEVKISDTLDVYNDLDGLMALDLIVNCVTDSVLSGEYVENISKAIGAGVGLAGCHGGMCDSFRVNTQWQFITGGQWVSHPGGDGIEYMVNINHGSSEITAGIADFPVKSEHYYLHIDPAIEVLATTRMPLISYYHASNKPVDMPVVWTKFWGNGRVFYSSLGHHDDVFDNSPSAQEIMRRGMIWAAAGKQIAVENNLTTDKFESTLKMY